jgi:hypothetical protein
MMVRWVLLRYQDLNGIYTAFFLSITSLPLWHLGHPTFTDLLDRAEPAGILPDRPHGDPTQADDGSITS